MQRKNSPHLVVSECLMQQDARTELCQINYSMCVHDNEGTRHPVTQCGMLMYWFFTCWFDQTLNLLTRRETKNIRRE